MKILPCCFTAILSLSLTHIACGQITYNEAIGGDLGAPATPTALGLLGLGNNTVTGLLNNSAGFDPDAFSFSIGPGMQMDSLSFTAMSGSGNHFFAFNNGPVNTGDGAGNQISTLINAGNVGTNILGGTLNNAGGSGLSGGPLGPGNYHVWFQELAGTNHNYSISLVTSVPEPSIGALVLAIAVGALGQRRRTS